MQRFLGELLMGGVRLRDLTGSMLDVPAGNGAFWSGFFLVDVQQQPLFERGRPYLLMLDDGRQGQVVVTELEPVEGGAMRVEFEPVGS